MHRVSIARITSVLWTSIVTGKRNTDLAYNPLKTLFRLLLYIEYNHSLINFLKSEASNYNVGGCLLFKDPKLIYILKKVSGNILLLEKFLKSTIMCHKA